MTRGLVLVAVLALAAPAAGQQPMPPDQQAEVLLTAARKAFADGNLPFAAQQFQEVVQKFGSTPSATAARLGLALCLLSSPGPDFAKAADLLAGPAGDGGFPDRGPALYHLGVCQRQLGLKAANPSEANQRFDKAAQAFGTARDWFAGKTDDDRAGRCRCDLADVQLRQNKVKEARRTAEPFEKDAALASNKHRPLGLYYHGLACFLDRDYQAAGRSLGQLAPFKDPAFGPHAQYLYGRVLHLGGESAEASVHYDAVLADYNRAKKDAAQALQQPEAFKNNPFEKARLEALAKGPPPEYVAGAAFHGACLNYEAGKFAEALPKFQAFAQDFPAAPLQPDALLRAGFCLVQLNQFDEAAKVLRPLAEKAPRLADQATFWLGKAQLGQAAAADPNNSADRDAKLKTALVTLKQAADKAGQMAPADPGAKARRPEMLFEYADALQAARQFKEAADVYQQLWAENALPNRREEVLLRLAAAAGAAGDLDRSNQRCDEFRRTFPQSVLTPAVVFRQAENSYARAVEAAKKPGNPAELKQRYEEAAGRYKEVADKFPEFERVNFARLGMAVCYAQLGNLEEAVKALEAIPGPDRTGELAPAAYLLADCLIRQAPARAEDALQENQVREKLATAAQLLEGFVAASPKAAEAPAALLKLGFCHKRLGATLADPNERNQTLTRAREAFERLGRDYPRDPLAGQGRLEQAKVKALMGDVGGAVNDLRQFAQNPDLQKSPVAPLAALTLATLHRQQNQPAEAAKVLDEARKRYEAELAKDPDRADWGQLLKYHHAVAVSETGKPADARKLFEEVVQQAKDKSVAAEAALRSEQCRLAEGKKLIEDGQKARGQAGNNPQKVQQADQLIQQGRAAVREAAEQLARRGDEFKDKLPAAEPRARMYYDAAWAWRALGEDRAAAAYKRLIDDFPETSLSVDARFELAELRADRGDHDEAVRLLREALDKEPSDRPVSADTTERIRLRLGASLQAKKDFAAAASQFEAVAGNPKSPYLAQALYRVGDCLLAAGQFAKAAEKLAAFRDRGELHNVGGVSDRAVLRLGQALAGAKEWDKSRQAFEVFLQRYANSPLAADARYGIGWALQNQAKYDEAVGQYQQVIAATTAEVAARAQFAVGQCRLAQKRYADAAAAFLVVPYTYDVPELGYAASLEAARAFAEDGKPDQAELVLRKLLKDAPTDSDWAKAAQERLGKLKKN